MAKIIDYSEVLDTLTTTGLRCVYPHSGAFGLPRGAIMHALGWIGMDDESIRPELLQHARRIEPPYEQTLANMVCHAWKHAFPGRVWVMPASHWAFELQFGGADWIPGMLALAGVDADLLRPRTDGSALEFDDEEQLKSVIACLFENMVGSDFTVAFPGTPIVGMLHHHKQVWWQTSDESLLKRLS